MSDIKKPGSVRALLRRISNTRLLKSLNMHPRPSATSATVLQFKPKQPATITEASKMQLTRHFSRAEMQCPRTQRCMMRPEFMEALEKVRVAYGKPMVITSGFRSAEHNKHVGGAPFSQHLFGNAVDISITNASDRFLLVREAIRHGFTGIETSSKHVHLDLRTSTPVFLLFDSKLGIV